MKRPHLFSIILLLALFFVACTPQGQSGADVEPAATLALERPSATPTTDFPTTTPAATAVPTVTPFATATAPAAEEADNTETVAAKADMPVLLARDPDQPLLHDRQPTITLTFDQAMDQESVAAALSVNPVVALDLVWLDDTVLTIIPVELLNPDTMYRFQIEATATSADGIALSTKKSWIYNTVDVIARVTWPEGTEANAPIVVDFNYAVDTETAVLQFTPALDGTPGWNDTFTQLTFQPTAPLLSSTNYRLELADGLLDANGHPLPVPPVATTITASAFTDISPKINSTVHPANPIFITFQRPMDLELTKAAFSLEPNYPGQLEWHENTLEFHPLNGRLPAEAELSVTISAAARDANGSPIMAEDYTWTFQTGAMTDLATFGSGEHSQIVSASGSRAVQFSYPSGTVLPATFNLYRYTVGQWLTSADTRTSSELTQSWTESPMFDRDTYIKATETHLPADLPAGVYLLNLVIGDSIEDQLVVFVTDYALTVHHDGEQIVAWVADLYGAPTAVADIRVYRHGQLLQEGQTDDAGLFRLTATNPEELKVVAQMGDEVTVSGLSGAWRSQHAANNDPYTINLYTNRPIYRPGQTVFFRAILRHEQDSNPVVLPFGTEVTAYLMDTNYERVQSAVLTTSHFGTVFGEFTLSDAAVAGQYFIIIETADQSRSQHFNVAPDAALDYSVRVNTDAPIYAQGDTIAVTVEVRDSDGQPVADQSVALEFYENSSSSGCFNTPAFDGFWFMGENIHGGGKTDANGRALINVPAEMGYNSHSGPSRSNIYHSVFAINASTTIGGDTISGFSVIEVANAGVALGMDVSSRIKTPGVEFWVDGWVKDVQGGSMNGRSQTLSLMAFSEEDYDYNRAIQSVRVTLDENGRFHIPFAIQHAGHYELHLMGQDVFGNDYTTRLPITAYASGYIGDYGNYNQIDIQPDRDSYVPGDTARLLIRSHINGPALLTLSGTHLSHEQIVQLSAPATVVELPIAAADAPNVFVTVQAWAEQLYPFDPANYYNYQSVPDRSLMTAQTELRVNDPSKIAHVTIAPNQENIVAGQTAAFTVRVTNYQDEPISAELSLALVDEAIFGQYSAHTSPLMQSFYPHRNNEVNIYHSLAPMRYFPGDGFGGCGCGGDWYGDLPALNSEFSDTAVWFPSLITDANGEATVTITMPNTPGTWRLTAKAVTADTQVSETAVTITTE